MKQSKKVYTFNLESIYEPVAQTSLFVTLREAKGLEVFEFMRLFAVLRMTE